MVSVGAQGGSASRCEGGDGRGAAQIVVETRGGGTGGRSGAPGASCWQTVLPLMAVRPVTVGAGSVVWVRAMVALPDAVEDPVQYSLSVRVSSGAVSSVPAA